MARRLPELPPHARASVEEQLLGLDFAVLRIGDCERRLEVLPENNAEGDLLKTMPGVGPILSAVIALEIGDVQRFASAERLVSYAGLVHVLDSCVLHSHSWERDIIRTCPNSRT